jgi:WD40 repeat protein
MIMNKLRWHGVLFLGAALSACGDSVDPEGGPRLRILAGANLTDTIGAAPVQGLVVQVINESGRPEAGVEVRFDATSQSSLMRVGRVGDAQQSLVTAATTDGNGRAIALVRFGTRAGAGFVVVSAPIYNLVDTARYTLAPGAAVRVTLSPKDTAVERGATFRYRGSTVDRAGNARLDPATYESTRANVLVTSSGDATAVEHGFAVVKVRVQIGSTMSVDSGRVAVVPQARIAVAESNGGALFTVDLSGSGRTQIAASALASSWAPDGTRLVFNNYSGLWLIDMAGNVTAVPTPGVSGATWPEYSADGQWIYFQGNLSTGTHIFRIRPDATGMELLTPGIRALMPTPSPDGRSVAFTTQNYGGQLHVLDLASRTARIIGGPQETATAPRWSPDGNWIAYTGSTGLTLIRPDGTGLRRITGSIGAGIAWSPDSRYVIGFAGVAVLIDVVEGVGVPLPWSGIYPAWRR